MTKGRKAVVACEVFESELRAVMPVHSDVHLVLVPAALHTDMARLEGEIERALSACRSDGFEELFVIYGGKCCLALDSVLACYGAVRLCADNCLDILTGPLKAATEAEGSIVFTPGWIRAWPFISDALGWDAVETRLNLGRYSAAVVYDAGVDPLTDEDILWFFELTGLYVDVRPLDLGHFRKAVRGLLGLKDA
ncbi:MAG: DUF1638 domain-containing protein [Pseudomonadota bacterium]